MLASVAVKLFVETVQWIHLGALEPIIALHIHTTQLVLKCWRRLPPSLLNVLYISQSFLAFLSLQFLRSTMSQVPPYSRMPASPASSTTNLIPPSGASSRQEPVRPLGSNVCFSFPPFIFSYKLPTKRIRLMLPVAILHLWSHQSPIRRVSILLRDPFVN